MRVAFAVVFIRFITMFYLRLSLLIRALSSGDRGWTLQRVNSLAAPECAPVGPSARGLCVCVCVCVRVLMSVSE